MWLFKRKVKSLTRPPVKCARCGAEHHSTTLPTEGYVHPIMTYCEGCLIHTPIGEKQLAIKVTHAERIPQNS